MVNAEKQFSCEKCDTIFSSNQELNYHWQPVHEGVRYPCDLCNYKANQKSELKKHYKSIHEKLCYLCGLSGDMKLESRKQMQSRKHLGPPYFNNPF